MHSYSAVIGNNSDLIEEVGRIYFKSGDVIADVTYGKGAFWNKVDLENITLLKSDIHPREDDVKEMDFTRLDYADESIDVHVLDPPYMHTPGKPQLNEQYRNAETTRGMYHGDIMAQMYAKALAEARRVLKKKGLALVKCQDEIQSGKQLWSIREIMSLGELMGFYVKDLAVLVRTDKPPVQHKQQHLRRRHSYLVILQKDAR